MRALPGITAELTSAPPKAPGSPSWHWEVACSRMPGCLVSVRQRLVNLGLSVLLPRRLGPNDGAVSYGQAAVAAASLPQREPAC